MKRKILTVAICMAMAAVTLFGCGNASSHEPVKILIAAAASLENAYVDELIPMFEKRYDYITVEGT